MKFLVTGSAGLIGSQIVKDLVQKNHKTYSCYHDQKPLQGIPTHLDLSDENQTGWRPQYNFDDALKQTVTWYLNNQSWWEPLIDDDTLHPQPWTIKQK